MIENQSTSFFPARWIVQFDKTNIFILFVSKMRHVYSFMSISPPVFFSLSFFSREKIIQVLLEKDFHDCGYTGKIYSIIQEW